MEVLVELARGVAPPPFTPLWCVLGASAVYYTPGFGPWPLGWGWFLLGALTGVLLLSAVLLGSYQAGA